MDRKEIRNVDTSVIEKINWKIASTMKGMAPFDPVLSFALNYASYLISLHKFKNAGEFWTYLEKEMSDERTLFIKQIVGENLQVAFELAVAFDTKAFLCYMLVFSREGVGKNTGESGTPESISKLALEILKIKDTDSVADFGCGVADFIIAATENNDMATLYGIDINTYSCEIAKIRTELFAATAGIELGNMFNTPKDNKFDKIFSNYPFGMKQLHLQAGGEFTETLYKKMPDIKKATSSDWIFNALMLEHLEQDGKAVAIMTNGGTWNSIDQRIREYFVRNGLVEAIILLPAKLFDFTSIQTTMIVFSYNNDSVRMVDATNLCEQGRRQNYLTEGNIREIVKLLAEDGELATSVSNEVIKENNCVLNPSRYLAKTVRIKDGVPFGDLMKRITRGAPLKASELDDLVSDDPTDTQYLMLANIQSGIISEDLPYLKSLDQKLDKYCIHSGDLLLSKNGAPFKVAVAEVKKGMKMLGNGNLFIIELDNEKINPYFIKAFFDSEAGTAALNSIVVGATIPNISAESLKKLLVPLPTMEKQNEIAALYQAKQDEIKTLKTRIQKAEDELRGIFGEVE